MSSLLEEHLGYVADPVRLERFKTAVAQIVKHGDRITDLGCGTGVLGLLCLRAGAAQVYAVDAGQMIEVARESLVRAGWSDRVRFIHGYSRQIDLPEPVDVVICDQVGYFGFDAGIVESLDDARRRFLKPLGTLIPARIKLQLAGVESTKCHEFSAGWRGENVPPEFHWVNQHAVNSRHAVQIKREELLGTPAELGEIDFRAENPGYFFWDAELRMARDGVMHGLAGWFECELANAVWMTNSPLSDQAIDRPQAFLPIGEAVAVKSGDLVQVKLRARPTDNLIAWDVRFAAGGKKFSHSTWHGELLMPEQIAARNPAHVPRRNREGEARMIVLGYCDGNRTVSEIEQSVLREHPDLFPTAEETSRFIARVLGRDAN